MSIQPTSQQPAAPRTYETSVTRVEEIIRRLDAGEASLGETLELVREGRDLIEHCAGELEAVGDALEELRLDDLVARLEGDSGGVGTAKAKGAAGSTGTAATAGSTGTAATAGSTGTAAAAGSG